MELTEILIRVFFQLQVDVAIQIRSEEIFGYPSNCYLTQAVLGKDLKTIELVEGLIEYKHN